MNDSALASTPAPRPSARALASQLAVASLFGALGFNYGTWTSRLPALKAGWGLSTSQFSMVLLAAALGSVFSFPVTAGLLHRLGSRGASLLSGVLLPFMLAGLAAAPGWWTACAVMFVHGIVASTMDVAMNAQGVEVENAYRRPVMSRLHALFSFGTMGGALFASVATSVTTSVPWHFGAAALVVWAAVLLPRGALVADAKPIDGGTRTFALPSGAALWLGAMAFLGMIVEGGMVDWSTLYLKEAAGASQQVAPLAIASLQGTMLATRWFGDRFRVRWGARAILLWGSLLAGVSLALALAIGGVAAGLAGYALVGIGIAIVSPCVYAAGAKQGAVALASTMTLGSVGFLVGPPLIGAVAQANGLAWGLGVIAAGCFLLAWCSLKVRWD
jgi:MFS family permease